MIKKLNIQLKEEINQSILFIIKFRIRIFRLMRYMIVLQLELYINQHQKMKSLLLGKFIQ